MSKPYDVYHALLGLSPAEPRPPNYYRLLGLADFEPEHVVIEAAAEMRQTFVKRARIALEDPVAAEEILNLIAEAKLCLLDAAQKTAYDATLARQVEQPNSIAAEPITAQPVTPTIEIPRIVPQGTWIIGSSAELCDIVIDDPTVSHIHCKLRVASDSITIDDLASSNGVWINGKRIVRNARVGLSDTVTLGPVAALSWQTVVTSLLRRVEPAKFRRGRALRIGRGEENDVVIDDESVSYRHAIAYLPTEIATFDSVWLEDDGSTNGTSVGHQFRRISAALVKLDDELFLGAFSCRLRDLLFRFLNAS